MRSRKLVTLQRAEFPTPESNLDYVKVRAFTELSLSGERYTNPPVLGLLDCGTLVIIAGNHRIAGLLEAEVAEAEFWVWELGSRDEAEFFASEDNLLRRDLPALVKAEYIAKCAHYLRTMPVSHQLGAKGRPKGGDADIARRLGIPQASLRRHLAIGRLSVEAKAAAWELKLQTNQSALAAAAKSADPAEQVAILAQRARKHDPAPISEHTAPELDDGIGAERAISIEAADNQVKLDLAPKFGTPTIAGATAPAFTESVPSSLDLEVGSDIGRGADAAAGIECLDGGAAITSCDEHNVTPSANDEDLGEVATIADFVVRCGWQGVACAYFALDPDDQQRVLDYIARGADLSARGPAAGLEPLDASAVAAPGSGATVVTDRGSGELEDASAAVPSFVAESHLGPKS
jgi:hypothetical protein